MAFTPRPRSPVNPHHSAVLSKPRKSRWHGRPGQLMALRFGWVVLVVWYEVGTFYSSLSSCHFPDSTLRATSGGTKPTHVAIIADPHLPHPEFSHPEESSSWVNSIRQGFDELFMRKSWSILNRIGRIDAVVFLGDMLDYGREKMTDAEYDDYFKLFKRIFSPSRGTEMYYLPGNYDIPLGNPGNMFEQAARARARFANNFGPLHSVVNVTGHSLVLLDSIGLVEEDYRRYGAEVNFEEYNGDDSSVIEFIKRIQADPLPSPIVFSHIPLPRPESARCGPLREGREDAKIRKGVGPGYQNLLGRQTSHFIVDAIDPVVVFSGDDHDYCDMVHADTGVREVTVKSFSPSTGVSRPGFQLLSLVPPEANMTTYADVPCILPDQSHVYWWVYMPLAVVTCAWLLFTNARQAWARSGADLKSKGSAYGASDEKKAVLSSWGSSTRLRPLASGPSSPLLSPRMNSDDPEQGQVYDASPLGSRQSSHLDLTDQSVIRRTSSGASLLPGGGGMSARRNVALPRIKSATDWASEAKKDKPVLNLMLDPGAKRSRVRAIGRWLWRSRRSVLVRTWTEMITIFAPAILVWFGLNALFFL